MACQWLIDSSLSPKPCRELLDVFVRIMSKWFYASCHLFSKLTKGAWNELSLCQFSQRDHGTYHILYNIRAYGRKAYEPLIYTRVLYWSQSCFVQESGKIFGMLHTLPVSDQLGLYCKLYFSISTDPICTAYLFTYFSLSIYTTVSSVDAI